VFEQLRSGFAEVLGLQKGSAVRYEVSKV
jgi:hypothetical protein